MNDIRESEVNRVFHISSGWFKQKKQGVQGARTLVRGGSSEGSVQSNHPELM